MIIVSTEPAVTALVADPLTRLADEGVSVWLDGFSRPQIASGGLAKLVEKRHVVGVTADPSVLRAAIGSAEGYEDQLDDLAVRGVTSDEAVRMMTAADARAAADVLRPVYDATAGRDGRVAVPVDPRSAHDRAATVAEARQLVRLVDRPNVMIGIPATRAGLGAITEVVGLGISVAATAVFSLERHYEVMHAYLAGLEKAGAAGLDLSAVHSVASLCVSRLDAGIDERLTLLGTREARDLRGRAGLAHARLAHEAYEEMFGKADGTRQPGSRWTALAGARANAQRPLWASTVVTNPAERDTRYVEELVAPGTVHAMTGATLDAVAERGVVRGNTVNGGYTQARADLAAVEALGVSYEEVVGMVEKQGVAAFGAAWQDLSDVVAKSLNSRGVDGE
ncbi:transaldolase [Streptomyces scabiei]|nr:MULTISPECIES: transaldolase [Streptomyces]MBP5871081.1 transaldolase [Streptomyces sp. LBUM 1485]MBP5879609.1 transaldolase [Streptomyces sp. LBUM 1477]MBP5887442.1 transaldolase [Streptomyces sp. LBUM 1487]MBP5913007.1 transaldolase [Streptomyces sp. LBUM 1486]MDW8477074.1 transaldolase [Streptomyces scabiei]